MAERLTDWREMDAGRNLDWLIAQRLGWRVTPDDHYPEDFAVRNPDGQVVRDMLSEYGLANFPYDNYVPRYSADLNAAITLVSDMVHNVRLELTDMGWKADVIIWSNDKSPHSQHADTPALAVCRAWLAWQDAGTD